MQQTAETSYDGSRLRRTLAEFRAVGRMDVAFGGPVLTDGSAVEITGLCGTQTRALANLRVRSGDGLGGKALLISKPVSVSHYYSAQGITHTYDRPVRAEHLETVTALPVVVDRVPRMVVYVASRARVGLGDRWYDAFVPLVRRLERDVAVDDEVRRRLAHLDAPAAAPRAGSDALSRGDIDDIARELTELAALIDDEALRARVDRVRDRVESGKPGRDGSPRVALAAREVDVLEQVALGRTNKQVAAHLGLEESTVKSYLKSAARKLHATNRVHAVALAREAGVIS